MPNLTLSRSLPGSRTGAKVATPPPRRRTTTTAGGLHTQILVQEEMSSLLPDPDVSAGWPRSAVSDGRPTWGLPVTAPFS